MLFTIGGLTGVVLSNASLDIAFHDNYTIYDNFLPYFLIGDKIFKLPHILSPQQLGPFTVGLIDGDGSLQVNHWRKKNLQFRLVVKLADKHLNYEMLEKIAKVYGGYVKKGIEKNSSYVQWIVNDQKTFHRSILPLLKEFKPLTSRMRLQYEFFTKFILNPNLELYFLERQNKYKNRDAITPLFTACKVPNYFTEWLAGFIEAEGSFSHRVKGNYSFSIAQNHDFYLIEAIRNYYGLQHITIQTKINKTTADPFYEFSVGSAKGTRQVIDHCATLLQGYKYYQLAVFVQKSKVFQERTKEFFT